MKKSIIVLSTVAFLSSGFISHASADTYTVKKGDTLEQIAAQYNLSVQQLQELNDLSSDRLQINQQLITSTSSLTKKGASNNLLDPTQTKTYTVVKGDTLSKIAKKYKLTVATLKQLNPLSSDKLQIGDTLIVSKTITQAVEEASETTTIDPTQTKTYTVVKGDTLSEIAEKYKITVAKLKQLNPVLLKSDVIIIGQKLTVGKSSSNTGTSTKDQQVDTVITEAKKVIGAPYLAAGISPRGFDSSGFIYYVFKQAGYKISRSSVATYYKLGKEVSSPKPGDLIFFALGSNKAIVNHSGIYLGDNEFIHVTLNKGVIISSLTNSYYQSRLIGYKRLSF